uniref:Glycosyltransferase n=1 Tax=Kalanchoe fedtschenkoi TaxID=63787 RepID=A0A7N0RDT5_KALFE
MASKQLHVAMYPWFAVGHLTAFIHLANKLAERSIRVSFFIPARTRSKVEHFNRHPDRIAFVPIPVPHVEGLPPGAETTSDVPFPLHSLIVTAMDETMPFCQASLERMKPDIVFFDFTHWLPALAREMGIKAVHFCCISSVTIGYLLSPARNEPEESDLYDPPPGFPASCIKLKKHEARGLFFVNMMEYGKGIRFMDRQIKAFMDSDAISFKALKEIEGPYLDYVAEVFKRPVFPAGPIVPEQPVAALDTRWASWLSKFKPKTVIYCAFGSECVLKLDQFQELVLGFELTGLPFLVALKPPAGADSAESALPDGFQNRVKDRGVVHGGWVQQQLILEHPAIGCFVTHCGSGSQSEALMNECQLVLFPQAGDQIINARMMGLDLRVGVEVEKDDEDGSFSKEGVCKAVKDVMEEGSDVGKEVRANHAKWREFLRSEGLDKKYIDGLVQSLQSMKA